MDIHPALITIQERLESLLSREFSAKGKNLAERVEKADVPQELRGHLRKLVWMISKTGPDAEAAELLDVAFFCGQIHEQLETLAAARLVEPFNYVHPDGTPGPEIAPEELSNVAESIRAWNAFMRKIADFFLKLLLVMVVVALVGLFLGVL